MNNRNREHLRCARNPDPRHDYVVDLAAATPDGTRLWIRYVPDRDVLEPGEVRSYIDTLPSQGLEALALTVMDDLLNQAVPRWIEVQAERTDPLPHRVTVEDCQPTWSNPALLARFTHQPPGG